MNEVNTANVISKGARHWGEKVAVVSWDTKKRLSFREIDDRANRLVNGLLSLGVSKGDTVASLNRNCPQHIEVYFATLKGVAKRTQMNTSACSGANLSVVTPKREPSGGRW